MRRADTSEVRHGGGGLGIVLLVGVHAVDDGLGELDVCAVAGGVGVVLALSEALQKGVDAAREGGRAGGRDRDGGG